MLVMPLRRQRPLIHTHLPCHRPLRAPLLQVPAAGGPLRRHSACKPACRRTQPYGPDCCGCRHATQLQRNGLQWGWCNSPKASDRAAWSTNKDI